MLTKNYKGKDQERMYRFMKDAFEQKLWLHQRPFVVSLEVRALKV